MPQSSSISGLCTFCQAISDDLSTHHSTWKDGFQANKSGTSVLDLLDTASSCRLCELIISSLGRWSINGSYENLGTIKSYFASLPNHSPRNNFDLIRINLRPYKHKVTTISVQIPLAERSCISLDLNITADEGREAALSDLVGTTAIASSIYACRQINTWLSNCLSEHELCKLKLSGAAINETSEPVLPKRVLSVENDSVVLIETQGLRGNYCALSHCWGPVQKQPLRTTKETISSHLRGIPFKNLPKTFQDAVIVTRNLNLRYLWIDSLSIVQDDEKEWEEESGKMGSIYEHARLTLAAADAADSSEGMFTWEKYPAPVLIPSRCGIGRKPSTILISTVCPPIWYSETVLARRAWALQEWQISRRYTFFTAEGASWKCKEASRSSSDQNNAYTLKLGWSNIVEDYSRRQLTYKNDRLVALYGLANEMKKSREDEYHFGVWTGNLPEHLLWRSVLSVESEDIPEIPSWSWASRGGEKIFISNTHPLGGLGREVTTGQLKIAVNTLHIQGTLKMCSVAQYSVNVTTNFGLFRPWVPIVKGSASIHYILNFDTKTNIVGLVSLDRKPCTDYHCLFLVIGPGSGYERKDIRDKYPPIDEPFPDDPNSEPAAMFTYVNNIFFVGNRPNSNETATKAEIEADPDLKTYMEEMAAPPEEDPNIGNSPNPSEKLKFADDYDKGPYVNWVLILERVPGEEDKFKRAGMGIVLSNSWAEGERMEKLVHII